MRPTEAARPGLARRRTSLLIPEGVDSRSLHAAVRAELRSLPKDLAEIVGAHLVVAGHSSTMTRSWRTRMPRPRAGVLPGCRSSARRQLKRRTPLVGTTLR